MSALLYSIIQQDQDQLPNAPVDMEYGQDRDQDQLPNAPVDMENDINRTGEERA